MTLKVLELFGGIGAPRAALERLDVDFKIVDYVEIDKFAVKSYNAMYGENYEPQDITKWNKDLEVDMIVHGSPCQDFSLAGNGAGGEEGSGTRSSLMWHTVRIVEKLKPTIVVWENVKAVLNKNHKPTFDKYIDRLNDLGYTSYYQVMNAKHYGIPQNRERVFVVSILGEHEMYLFPQKQELKIYLKDLLESDVDENYYLSDKMMAYLNTDHPKHKRKHKFERNQMSMDGEDVARTITTREGSVVDSTFIKIKNGTKKGYLKASEGDGVDISYPSSNTRRGRVQKGLSQTLTTDDSKAVVVYERTLKEQYCDSLLEKDMVDEYDVIDHSYTRERMTRDEVKKHGNNIMPTMTTRPDTFGVVVNQLRPAEQAKDMLRIRKLTPKECWRLMGFDDHYFEKAEQVNSNAQLYKQAGNSIVVDVLVELFKPLVDVYYKKIVDDFINMD